MNIRDHRMNTEWQLLEALADANRATVAAITRSQNEFHIVMRASPAWIGDGIETEHTLRYVYPRYYPSLPLECYFSRAISHINVDPMTGFVCLWQDYRPAQTIIDAILITRAIMACKVANWDPVHRMQRNTALEHPGSYTLPMPSLIIPEICHPSLPRPRIGRRRLTHELDDQALRESNRALSDIE
jgi:ubiquitin-protein ligase